MRAGARPECSAWLWRADAAARQASSFHAVAITLLVVIVGTELLINEGVLRLSRKVVESVRPS